MKNLNERKYPMMAIYLKVEPRRSFEKEELDVYFGNERQYHAIVPKKNVVPCLNDYVVKITLSSLIPEKGMILGKIESINGGLEERLFPQEDILILRAKENRVIGRKCRGLQIPDEESTSYAYLDVRYAQSKCHNNQTLVMFGRRTSDKCTIFKSDLLIKKTPEFGHLKVILRSERNPASEETVEIGIPTCNKGLQVYFLPKRYIHPFYKEDDGKDNSNRGRSSSN